MALEAMDMCLRVLKESTTNKFDSYNRQEQCIDHIPYYLSGLSRAHFSDNVSRNSCICLTEISIKTWLIDFLLLFIAQDGGWRVKRVEGLTVQNLRV